MTRTTPPRPLNVLIEFPELACSACGADFDLLVSLDSKEWDGIVSWRPVEDDARDGEAQCPTGLTHGRWGETRIFVCSADLAHPFQLDIQ